MLQFADEVELLLLYNRPMASHLSPPTQRLRLLPNGWRHLIVSIALNTTVQLGFGVLIMVIAASMLKASAGDSYTFLIKTLAWGTSGSLVVALIGRIATAHLQPCGAQRLLPTFLSIFTSTFLVFAFVLPLWIHHRDNSIPPIPALRHDGMIDSRALGFTADFPTAPHLVSFESFEDSYPGTTHIFVSTRDLTLGTVAYQVIVYEQVGLQLMSDARKREILEEFPATFFATGGATFIEEGSNSSTSVMQRIERDYRYKIVHQGEELYYRGTGTIIDDRGYFVSITYPPSVESQIDNYYPSFVSSLTLVSDE